MTIYKIIIYLNYLLFIHVSVFAQGSKMFVEQIQGKTIVRENYSNSGKLIGRQEFVVGKLQQSGKNYLVSIQTKLYDEAGKLESTYMTTYRCQPEESNVLLSVFTIKPRKQKISVSVESGDLKNIYGLSSDEFSKAISLKMDIENGILNFLGSKNYVIIEGRSNSQYNDKIIINSAMTIKAYLLGIRIKTIKYRVTEYLTSSGILQKQIFKESDGSYFIMDYQ